MAYIVDVKQLSTRFKGKIPGSEAIGPMLHIQELEDARQKIAISN